MTPLIGVTSFGRREKTVINPPDTDHYCVAATYVDAVRMAGGAAVVLPGDELHIERWMAALDGIVFSGGGDIDPRHYGGDAAHPQMGPIHADRDTAEMALTRAILDHGKMPALFICRGIQVLNTVLGGTLHEDIADLGPDDIHRSHDTSADFWARQPVTVEPGTVLAQAVGHKSVMTLSRHHQAIREPGAQLTVSARAADGIIKAVEMVQHPFLVGVQWHPEASVREDPDQLHVFGALVAAARAQQGCMG